MVTKDEFNACREEVKDEFSKLRHEMHLGFDKCDARFLSLRELMQAHTEQHRQFTLASTGDVSTAMYKAMYALTWRVIGAGGVLTTAVYFIARYVH